MGHTHAAGRATGCRSSGQASWSPSSRGAPNRDGGAKQARSGPLGLVLLLALAGLGLVGCSPADEAADSSPAGASSAAMQSGPAASSEAVQPSTIFLVRHAEKADEPEDDPGLTPEGRERARDVARLLVDAEITHVHSSDFERTRHTGQPLADELGLSMNLYDHGDPGPFLDEVMATPGRHVIVGHSNTLPDLAERLGGDGYGEIVEAWEYNRLYILTPSPQGMETVLLRFGAPVSP